MLITYFYNVRFLKPNQIPVSTAAWDPKWFMPGKNKMFFKDKRGVINGIRCEELNPIHVHADGCPCNHKDPTSCKFIKSYRSGLDKLNFLDVKEYLDSIVEYFETEMGIENAEIVLMVYEKPANPCAERQSLIDWFSEHGVELKELKV